MLQDVHNLVFRQPPGLGPFDHPSHICLHAVPHLLWNSRLLFLVNEGNNIGGRLHILAGRVFGRTFGYHVYKDQALPRYELWTRRCFDTLGRPAAGEAPSKLKQTETYRSISTL